jgi:hypothetical protein
MVMDMLLNATIDEWSKSAAPIRSEELYLPRRGIAMKGQAIGDGEKQL